MGKIIAILYTGALVAVVSAIHLGFIWLIMWGLDLDFYQAAIVWVLVEHVSSKASSLSEEITPVVLKRLKKVFK